MTNKIIRLSLYEEVAERIRERINRKDLKPGDRIDELALAAELGISRTPLREALKVLQAEGLVTLVPRKGCFIAEISQQDIEDIYAILALLESRSAAAVAARVGESELARLELLHQRMESAAITKDFPRYVAANTAVHDALQQIGGNRWQHGIVSDLKKVLKLSKHVTLGLPGRMEQSLQEHRELMSTFRRHDEAGAEAVMYKHMMNQHLALTSMADLARRGAGEIAAPLAQAKTKPDRGSETEEGTPFAA